MIKEMKNTIPLCMFDNINSVELDGNMVDAPWNQIKELFERHDIREQKDGPNFWPVKLKDPSKWELSPKKHGSDQQSYRTNANVESISLVVLDLDQPGCKEKVEANFSDVEYILYSTHSYNEDQPYKYRIILPLESPILAEEWEKNFNILASITDGDPSCKNLSRLYYFPSHSPNAGVQPEHTHNRGELLSKEKILTIAKEAAKQNIKVKQHILPATNTATKRHFSGTVVTKEKKYSSNDFSYEGMCKRHSSLIESLKIHNSRHDFALKAIDREIRNNGQDADIDALMKFIFRASLEYSSKPIHLGNTISELPELLSSSISKRAPEIYGRFKSGSDYTKYVEGVIQTALKQSFSLEWEFPEKPVEEKEVDTTGYSIEAIKNRNRNAIIKLDRSRDMDAFLRSFLLRESRQEFIDYKNLASVLNLAQNHIGDSNIQDKVVRVSDELRISDAFVKKLNVAIKLDALNHTTENKKDDEAPSPSP